MNIQLSKKENVSSKTLLTHSSTSTSENIGVGWQSYFKNNDEGNCPIKSCILKGPNCADLYNGFTISISTEEPW